MKNAFLMAFVGGFIVTGLLRDAGAGSRARPGLVSVDGAVKTRRAWTLEQLKKLGHTETVTLKVHGDTRTARGVRLWTLVQAAQPKMDMKSREFSRRYVLSSEGAYLHRAGYSVKRLLPSAGNNSVFLVWEMDGKPFAGKHGPLRVVQSGELKPMQWNYSIDTVRWFVVKQPRKRRAGQ